MNAIKTYLLKKYVDELLRIQQRVKQANKILNIVLEDLKQRVVIKKEEIKNRQVATMMEAIQIDIKKRYEQNKKYQ